MKYEKGDPAYAGSPCFDFLFVADRYFLVAFEAALFMVLAAFDMFEAALSMLFAAFDISVSLTTTSLEALLASAAGLVPHAARAIRPVAAKTTAILFII
jgi:hypothetical protein